MHTKYSSILPHVLLLRIFLKQLLIFSLYFSQSKKKKLEPKTEIPNTDPIRSKTLLIIAKIKNNIILIQKLPKIFLPTGTGRRVR